MEIPYDSSATNFIALILTDYAYHPHGSATNCPLVVRNNDNTWSLPFFITFNSSREDIFTQCRDQLRYGLGIQVRNELSPTSFIYLSTESHPTSDEIVHIFDVQEFEFRPGWSMGNTPQTCYVDLSWLQPHHYQSAHPTRFRGLLLHLARRFQAHNWFDWEDYLD